jgi:DNA-binding NtrC family response regulator
LRDFCKRIGQPVPDLSLSALAALHSHDWPGNVRELKNVMERAVLLAGSGTVTQEHVLPDPMLRSDSGEDAEEDATHRVPGRESVPQRAQEDEQTAIRKALDDDDERQRLIRALELCGGNQTRAAALLGISRRTLINRLDRWKLPRPQKR